MRREIPVADKWAVWPGARRVVGSLAVAALLMLAPGAFAQHVTGGHASGFGGHVGGFAGGHAGTGFAGHGGFAGPRFGGGLSVTAPRFYSSFGSHSFSTAPRGSFGWNVGRVVPDYASSWGVAHREWGERGGGHFGEGHHDRHRSPYRGNGYDNGYGGYGYGGYGVPWVNSWEVTPWDLGYPDFTGYSDMGYGEDESAAAAQPEAPQQPEEAAPAPEPDYRPEYQAEPPDIPESYTATPAPDPAPPAAEPALTLIFKDGHRRSIRNYAMTGNSVIVMDDAASGRMQRIPLTELNLPATEQAAQQAGLDFTPPSS